MEEAELGLAPLIDVVLLLLIFFLVTTSFATPRIPLELPGASSGEPPKAAKLSVVLTADGGLFLDEEPVDLETLGVRFGAAEPDTDLELRADEAVPHGRVVGVLDRARENGIVDIAVAVAGSRPEAAGDDAAAE